MARLEYHGFARTPGSPYADVSRALAAAEGPGRPGLLLYWPVGRVNPYQGLLYSTFPSHGIVPVPLAGVGGLERMSDIPRTQPGAALHLHWLSGVLKGAATPAECATRRASFLGQLDSFLAVGGQIIWTVHNVYPHGAVFLDEEVRLRRAVAERAAVVHVMSFASLAAVGDHLSLEPDKVVVAPHPSYAGAYPDYVSRQEARAALGIGRDEAVFAHVGAIRSYKGLGRLLAAFDLAAPRLARPARLVVAGQPDASPATAHFLDRARVHPSVLVSDVRIAVEKMQYLLRAADVGVVAYERVLNSGVALLYATFGVPIVAADAPSLWERLDPAVAERVTGETAADLAQALVASQRLRTAEARAAATRWAAQFDPAAVSGDFARELRGRLWPDAVRAASPPTRVRHENAPGCAGYPRG